MKRKSRFQRICIRCKKPTKSRLKYCDSCKPKSNNGWNTLNIMKESERYYKRLEELCKTA